MHRSRPQLTTFTRTRPALGQLQPKRPHQHNRSRQFAAGEDKVPAGCARYTVRIKKRLGLVLESDKQGNIFVAEIAPDSNAAKTGEITVGDQLIATSGYMYTKMADYGGAMVRQGEKEVRLVVRQENFDSIMAAIQSHPGNIPVTLEFQRCQPSSQ